MSDPNLNLGIGGGLPPLGGGPSLEDEEKALKKGNTGVLIGGVLAGIAVVVGLGFLLLNGDDGEQYGVIGRQINGMKQEHFDSFWGCALPGEQLGELRTNQDLQYAITKRARSNPRRYAGHIRERCMVKLDEHGPGLRALIAPADLQAQLDALGTALDELHGGWGEYTTHLAATSEAYEEDEFRADMNKIVKGWYDYKRAHGELNTAISAQVN